MFERPGFESAYSGMPDGTHRFSNQRGERIGDTTYPSLRSRLIIEKQKYYPPLNIKKLLTNIGMLPTECSDEI
jgi:hypothetical protein